MTAVSVCGRFLRVVEPTGTQRSARSLLVATLGAIRARVVVYGPKESLPSGGGVELHEVRFRSALFDHLWEQCVFPLAAPGGVLWTLMGTGPVFHPSKVHVMVVHDLNYQILPDVFGKAFRAWYRVACGLAARRAQRVVCFTEYVRGTVHQRLGIPMQRISVVPQGPGLAGLDSPMDDAESLRPDNPHFLCVGSLQPHKNLAGVLAAWKHFSAKYPGHTLKVVGRPQGNFAGTGVDLRNLPLGVEFTGYVRDEELIALYRGATGFLYPSMEEGFGLPVVEAFYCGCPVITSNRSCLPEVAGDAAILVDPSDANQIADAMASLVGSEAVRSRYRQLGFDRARHFTWQRAGRAMAGILQEAGA